MVNSVITAFNLQFSPRLIWYYRVWKELMHDWFHVSYHDSIIFCWKRIQFFHCFQFVAWYLIYTFIMYKYTNFDKLSGNVNATISKPKLEDWDTSIKTNFTYGSTEEVLQVQFQCFSFSVCKLDWAPVDKWAYKFSDKKNYRSFN